MGLQFGIILLPGEIIKVALWPFISNIGHAFYYLFDNTFFVLRAAISAICAGIDGYLDASDEPLEETIDQ